MKLYIAEKPSLGRAIAAALPKPHRNQTGYIQTGNGDIVTWCIGHILEQAEPDDYDPKYKQWRLEHLPISPIDWQLKPKSKTRSQLTIIRKLVKSATTLVNAGDPDREGQLLVDEVIHYLKVPKAKVQSCERLLVSDLNTSAVQRALSSLKSNQDYSALSVSALARSRADWLYGINMTRAYSILGQRNGYQGVLSVGRVQTPVLGLVVRRDKDIEDFVPKDYYQVQAHIQLQKTSPLLTVQALWQPSDACQPHMDEEDRVINRALAENVANRITDQPALVDKVTRQNKTQQAPLPYNLSALQIDAAKAFGFNAKQVLDLCQSLYEKHKIITYPRSDCRYLPKEQHGQAPGILSHLAASSLSIAPHLKEADASIRSKAFNDKQVGAHHAIVPTEKGIARLSLQPNEFKVYSLIARQYAAQFFATYRYQHTEIRFNIAGGCFITKENLPTHLGWKQLFGKDKDTNDNGDSIDKTRLASPLAELEQGEQHHCQQGEVLAKVTQAPQPFTDASLLAAMTGIARFVTDVEIKKILKETDGLGTEATRAGIIELLFKRGFLTRAGKTIRATDIGKALINALPLEASTPDMTALWEAKLNDICEKRLPYQGFMQPLGLQLTQLLDQAQAQDFSNLPKGSNGQFKTGSKKKRYKRKATTKSRAAKTGNKKSGGGYKRKASS